MVQLLPECFEHWGCTHPSQSLARGLILGAASWEKDWIFCGLLGRQWSRNSVIRLGAQDPVELLVWMKILKTLGVSETCILTHACAVTHTHVGQDYGFPQAEWFCRYKLLKHINFALRVQQLRVLHCTLMVAVSILLTHSCHVKSVHKIHPFFLWILLLIQHWVHCKTLLAFLIAGTCHSLHPAMS